MSLPTALKKVLRRERPCQLEFLRETRTFAHSFCHDTFFVYFSLSVHRIQQFSCYHDLVQVYLECCVCIVSCVAYLAVSSQSCSVYVAITIKSHRVNLRYRKATQVVVAADYQRVTSSLEFQNAESSKFCSTA